MDSFLAWNIRGLNEPAKQFSVKQLLFKSKIVLAGILETRVKEKKKTKKKVLDGIGAWSCFDNYSHAYNRRIWLLFDSRKISVKCLVVGD